MKATDELPRSIVDELEEYFSRFLALSPGLALVLALWSIATHLHQRFDAFPYLAITSPTKRCGKTRVCELLGLACFNPLQTVSISAASLYRLLRTSKRTLLIDEAEYLSGKKDERASLLREILNAGYRKGQVVYRCKRVKGGDESEDFEPEPFDTFCPKALVLIGKLQDTLSDRCIEIRMERRAQAHIERFRYARVQAETAPLRQAVEQWANDMAPLVEAFYMENDLPFLHDREAELWLPLFSVCIVAAPLRFSELESVATVLSYAKSDDDAGDTGVQLLKDLRSILASDDLASADRVPTSVLLEKLNALEESPWASWFHGKGLNAQTLSRLLRPFNTYPQNIRYGGQVVKGYLRQSFTDAWERYL